MLYATFDNMYVKQDQMLACAIVKISVKCLIDRGIAKDWQWCFTVHLKHALHSDIQRLWDISKHNNFYFFLEISICTCTV